MKKKKNKGLTKGLDSSIIEINKGGEKYEILLDDYSRINHGNGVNLCDALVGGRNNLKKIKKKVLTN